MDGFINFINGVLNVKTSYMLAHHSGYRFTNVIPCDYNPKIYLSKELKENFLFIFGGDVFKLEMIRPTIRRCLEPADIFKTGFWLHEVSSTGQSSFIGWLKGLLKDNYVKISLNKLNMVERGLIRNKSLTIIPDG